MTPVALSRALASLTVFRLKTEKPERVSAISLSRRRIFEKVFSFAMS